VIEQRLAKLRTRLDAERLDALFVSDPFSRRYLSGFTGSSGYLLIDPVRAVLATDFRYWEQAGQQAPAFELFQAVGPITDWLGELFAPLGGKRIGFEQQTLTYGEYRTITGIIEELPSGGRPQFLPAPPIVEELRAIKDAGELQALEAAIALGDAAFLHAAERVRPGWTERQVARLIEDYIKDHGGEGTSFTTIVAGGARGAMPHARAGEHELREGEGVVIDMGALLDGYCSDMTRTIFLGEPTRQFEAVYDIVFTAQRTAEELIEPGMTGEYAHRLAQRVIEEAGHGEHFGHGLGHGIGLQVHEAPRLALKSTSVLAEGQVFSVEPGIYISGWGGVRIEDLVVLEHGRCRVLSSAPKSITQPERTGAER
jgi:Xaa-Pro aminopeptidase